MHVGGRVIRIGVLIFSPCVFLWVHRTAAGDLLVQPLYIVI
jgi:hypothetical protein